MTGELKNMNSGFKSQYFQQLAELEEGNFWFCARNQLICWAIHKYFPALKSFLEIGCGTGFVLSAISKRFPQSRLFGSEYLEKGLEYARQRVPSAEFTQMDARCIPYESAFDAIGAFDLLEHIEEDVIVLKQIYKALKPGGVAFVTVPQHRWLWGAVDDFACHVRRYNANDLHQKVYSVGFEIIRSTSFVGSLLPVMYLTRVLQRKKTYEFIDDIDGLRINVVLNKIFYFFLSFEFALIRVGISLPVGGSRLLVARKPLVTKRNVK